MVEQPISLRPARPEVEEGEAFAGYLNTAAEGFFRFWLGRHYARTIGDAFTRPGHDLSYQHATFAVREGRIVGMVSCYTAEQHRLSSHEPLREAEGYRALRASLVATAFSPIMRILDTLEEGDFYIQAIAVDEDCRGEGVGSLLFGAVEDRARASGSARLCLDVSSGNVGAQRLYERLGMSVVTESPRLLFAPRFRLLRMAMALSKASTNGRVE